MDAGIAKRETASIYLVKLAKAGDKDAAARKPVLQLLREGLDIPEWFSFPQVVAELRKTSPARSKQGFTVFFTGLSGSGKSTIANALMVKLMEMGGRPVTLLDGDVVRKHLSSELGFSKEHRDINIKRIGYVASEITKNGGIAICAPIAPYTATRRAVREMIEAFGAFIEGAAGFGASSATGAGGGAIMSSPPLPTFTAPWSPPWPQSTKSFSSATSAKTPRFATCRTEMLSATSA